MGLFLCNKKEKLNSSSIKFFNSNTSIKFALFYIFLILAFIPSSNNFQLSDLNNPELFIDEICSYNGHIEQKNKNNYTCTCQNEYQNDPNLNRKINNVTVQCSYEKKRRFITLFLSIFIPFGFDYLYLERIFIFLLIFTACLVMLIGNCFRFAISQNTNKYFQESKWNIAFIVFALIMIIWWIVNIILIGLGIIKDANGFDTVDDLDFLINLNTQN
jgi:hypothetical protein